MIDLGRLGLAQLSIGLGCVCVAAALVLAILLRVRRAVAAPVLLSYIVKQLRGGERRKAVKLCRAADVPATALALYALGLEEPAQIFGESGGGFRDAVPASAFGERVRARLAEATTALERKQRVFFWLAGLGLVGAGLALASWPLGRPALLWEPSPSLRGWPPFPLVVAVLGALAVVLSVAGWRRIVGGLRLLARELPALLAASEDLDEPGREAAAYARESLERARWRIAQPQPGGDAQQ